MQIPWYKSKDNAICVETISTDPDFFDKLIQLQPELGYISAHYENGLMDSLTLMGCKYTLLFEDATARDKAFDTLTTNTNPNG